MSLFYNIASEILNGAAVALVAIGFDWPFKAMLGVLLLVAVHTANSLLVLEQ